MKSIDNIYQDKGFECICGIDEAGRGPWAGAVYCAAVILPLNHNIIGLNDSKQLSESERDRLFDEIINKAVAYSVMAISNKQIDKTNILKATKQGMQKAVKTLEKQPDILLIDATNINIPEIPQVNLIKGDARSESIAAASILAKVSRDKYMKKLDKKYPEYGFADHKGYGTKQHQEALKKHGPCEIHRYSFKPVKEMLN